MPIAKAGGGRYGEQQVGHALVRSEESEHDLAAERRTEQVRQLEQQHAEVFRALRRLPAVRHRLQKLQIEHFFFKYR